jgi:hypothetical protein
MASRKTYTLGKSIQMIVNGPGGQIDLGNVIDVTSKPKYKEATSAVLDGPSYRKSEPDGHDVTITVDRTSRNIDDLVAAVEAGYWGAGGDIYLGTSTRYVTESDGTQSVYLYQDCDFQFDMGAFKAQSSVPLKISFYARYITRVS